MSLTNFVPEKNRVYVRLFDHDEAKERRKQGESVAVLAEVYGVTESAIYQVTTPGARAQQVAYHRRWRTGTCESCGGPAMRLVSGKLRHNPDGRVLCLRCRADEKRERLRFDESGELAAVRCTSLECANGQRWQSPENFTRGKRHREVRAGGIHNQCRACQTRARQRYRERRKVPCLNCGKPRLPASELLRADRPGRRDTGLCFRCYQEGKGKAA